MKPPNIHITALGYHVIVKETTRLLTLSDEELKKIYKPTGNESAREFLTETLKNAERGLSESRYSDN